MPDERVAIQPPSVEWVNESGKWPNVQPLRVELRLELAGRRRRPARARAARWRRSRARGPAGSRSTEITGAASRSRGGLEAAGDAGAAAERDHHGVGLERGAQDALDLVLVGRPDDGVGEPAEVAAALAHEVAQALAARVDDAVERVVGDVRGRLRARRAARRAICGAGMSRSLERDRRARRCARRRRPRCSRRNGASAGLSSCVKATPSSPQPHHFMAAARAGRVATAVMASNLRDGLA